MTSVLNEIISLLVGGLVKLSEGIGGGLSSLVENIFLNSEKTGLSTYGGVIIIFAGVSLAIGLCTKIVTWVTSLGN